MQIFFSTALPPNVRVEDTSTAFVVLVKNAFVKSKKVSFLSKLAGQAKIFKWTPQYLSLSCTHFPMHAMSLFLSC